MIHATLHSNADFDVGFNVPTRAGHMPRWLRTLLLCVTVVCASLLLPAKSAHAQATGITSLSCPDANIFSNLFNGVCWSSMFPLRIAGVDLFSPADGIGAPYNATSHPFCECNGSVGHLPTVGFTVGFWMPDKLIETTRYPYCSPTLGGISLTSSPPNGISTSGTLPGGVSNFGRPALGGEDDSSNPDEAGLRQFNMFEFPLLEILDLLNVPCNPDGAIGLDFAASSEEIPGWDKPELANYMNPETAVFANPTAMLALPVSCALASSGLTPQTDDLMFWAMGCWGDAFPLDGFGGQSDQVQDSSLVLARAMLMFSQTPGSSLANRTVGDDVVSGSCAPVFSPPLQKSAFKISMLFPVAEAGSGLPGAGGFGTNGQPASISSSLNNPANTGPGTSPVGTSAAGQVVDFSSVTNGRCAHRIGETTFRWGDWRTRPGTGEDQVYMIWRWVDCCVGVF
ncbi:TraU family protein [Burkholderia gladioli]|uniref:TraU family protein n=1 Tax=Burkholderia gladioli TaxID=28095 RepID=UPI001C5DBE9D|nr:TraU family protein [Burkholderia gladioli]MBW5284155.1 TraU family protein [Burkholderia gladioli]